MEKSRLLSQLDLLEKYVANKSSFKSKEEEIGNFRSLTGKILGLIEGPEKVYRDVVLKHTGQIDALINTLQMANDSATSFNVIKIISELVGRSNSGKRAQILVHHGVSKALLQCIYLESKEQCPCEEFLFLLHQVLYKVAVKDKRIGVRARISQCLPVVVNLLRVQINLAPHNRVGNMPLPSTLSKNILTLLYVLRLYSHNLINSSRLGRIGAIVLLLKMVSYSGRSNMTILKISMETLNLCVRTKSNSGRAINQGAMRMLLELFLDWYRIDSKDKQIKFRKCILCVIKNLVNLRSGKKAFLDSDGLHTLYGFCDANKLQNNMESLVTIASLILRKCFPKNRLPLSHYGSVLRCPLPNAIIHQNARVLLEEYDKHERSPSAPRSTSPLDLNPIIPILSCQGDNENRIDSFDGEDYFQEIATDDNLTIDPKFLSSDKQNNRIRALNLFRSLDRKLSLSRKESLIQQQHQMYLNRYCGNPNDSGNGNSVPQKSPIARSCERVNNSDQDYNDEKKDKNDQIFVEQMLVNSLTYQPPDDRPFDQLKQYYDKFLLERKFWKKVNTELKKKLSLDDLDRLDKSESSSEIIFGFCNDIKNSKENMNSSGLPGQLKTSSLDKKFSRITLSRNEINSPRITEQPEEKMNNFMRSLSSLQKPDASPLQPSGMYMKAKSGFNQTKNENININAKINDLVEHETKVIDSSSKLNFPLSRIPDLNEADPNNKLQNFESNEEFTEAYIKISSLVTRSLGRFSMIGYPDLMEDSVKMNQPEPLSDSFLQSLSLVSSDDVTSKSKNNNNNAKKSSKNAFSVPKKPPVKSNKANSKASPGPRPSSAVTNVDALAQNKILDDLRRIIDGEDILEKVVFDLESIIQSSMATYNMENSSHSNSDELQVDKLTPLQSSSLQFDSQFECGNLRKAIQIRQYEYDLILNPDVNNNHQIQWFYFRVSAMEARVPYRFNIINCEKPNSQFNFGMQPLLYSVKEAMLGKSYWKRYGTEIFYYKNHFARSAATCGGNIGKSYYTFTFVIEFPYSADVCYIAYHYPYSYTRLLTDLHQWTRKIKSSTTNSDVDADGDSKEKMLKHKIEFYSIPEDNIMFYIQELCTTILGNPVPVLTISNWPTELSDKPVSPKPYIFLTSRVHPGESNASWVMKGCIDYLLSDSPIAQQLRNLYIFKIIPMLNPDGVINGCHRCSMAGHDLNRRWLDPCEVLNPTIYHTKGLIMLLSKYGQSPLVYCDFHGHSRRKNVFMFGCSPFMSWINDDTNNPTYIDPRTEDKNYLILPNILNNISQAFSIDCCSFTIEKSKESTARVVVWRQFGVQRSYTMESTYCSFDQGNYKHLHINVPMLQEIGSQFVEALLHIVDSVGNSASRHSAILKISQDYSFNKMPGNDNSEFTKPRGGKSITVDILDKFSNDEGDDQEDDDVSNNEDYDDIESESDKEIDYNDDEDVEDSD